MKLIQHATGASVRGGSKIKSGSLKFAALGLGFGDCGVISKELAVNPQQVVISREKEKLALQELNDR